MPDFLKRFLSGFSGPEEEQVQPVQDSQSANKADSKADKPSQSQANLPALKSERHTLFSNLQVELRTPLTLILAPLESLLMGEHGKLTPEQSRLIKTVHHNSVKLLRLVSGLLDFSSIKSGAIQVSRHPVDVAALTGAIVSDFQSVVVANNKKLFFDPVSANLLVDIDRYLFERIVFNLISNAVKYTPSGGSISVSLKHANHRLVLCVADTGRGIDEEALKGLFKEASEQTFSNGSPGESSKVGLRLVKEFSSLMEGTIAVESKLGKGSTFTVDIAAPLVDIPQAFSSPPAAAKSAVELPLPKGSQAATSALFQLSQEQVQQLPKVVVAENNAELAEYVQGLLSDLCQIKVASDGDQALQLVHEWHPDLVLAAVMMPRRDGLSFCREVKSNPETSAITVVLLTALAHRDAMLQGWDAGADEYLFKPFHPAELVTRVRSLLRSVQQRKRAQEQIERLNEALEKRVIDLANANRELKSLASKLEQARDQALEASRFKSVFLANMSHEIRTPINGVISMSDMLMRTRLKGDQVEIANIIRDSANSLLDIINDILDFSKIEAGKLELEIVDFEVLHVVEGTAELVADHARQKKLSLMTYIAPDVPSTLRGDPGRLRQILLNLLSNAIKFTDAGEIVVQATIDNKDEKRCRIRFSVTDSGIGMAQETVYRLFQPFTQADGSITRRYGGTGLGLSIAKLLVELLGGRIGVRSTEGKGSTFWFSVPLDQSEATPDKPSGNIDLEGVNLLIVDPLQGTAQIIKDYANTWGMRSHSVNSGSEAIQALRDAQTKNDPFNITIVELQMPDMNGFEFAQAVLSEQDLGQTKLILCTSDDKERLGEGALKAGFSAYMLKPLKQSRLFDCLALVLDPTPSETALQSAFPSSQVLTTGELNVFQQTGIILVAEDNPVNQKVALLLLKELGFMAHVVASGREASEAASRTPYSLILMDCQMPDMDGLEATGAIRRMESVTGRHVPIVAMTAHAMQGDRERCIAAGMDDYVSKPVTTAKLQEVLERWFKTDSGAWRSTASQVFEVEFEPMGDTSQENEEEATPVNFESLKATCGDDGALELIGVFMSSTETLLERLDTAINEKNGKTVKAVAHELKGACASVGAQEMARIAKELEQAGLSENWIIAASLFDRLSDSYAIVQTFCRTTLESFHSAH